jgi:hypothetical protein
MMSYSSAVSSAADRLGLELQTTDRGPLIRRRGWSVQLNSWVGFGDDATAPARFAAAWALAGLRLGLDKCVEEPDKKPSTPLHFRRTNLRRYHEAPSVHGDHLPLLVPRLTRQLFEIVAGEASFSRPWLQPDLDILVVHETGRRLDILTTAEQEEASIDDDSRWEKVRSALFYQSYKLRPRQIRDVDGGSLRLYETSEGFGAGRALLLPEYDYDAAREYGFLAAPSRDQIIIARPNDQSGATAMLPALRDFVDDCLENSDFGLTDALFQLDPDAVRVHTTATFEVSEQLGDPTRLVGEVTGP